MKYLLIAIMSMAMPVYATDTILDLDLGDSVLATCTGEIITCPDCPADNDRFATHGPTHKDVIKLKQIDCRDCHGDDLTGTQDSVTSKQRGCIAPDGFYPPDGNQELWTMDPYGIVYDPTGRSAALFSAGVVVGCHNCHKEVEYKINGEEVKGKFEDIRKGQVNEHSE